MNIRAYSINEKGDYVMSKENLRILLYQKVAKEQSDFVEYLKMLPPDEIIDKAYEKALRDDILLSFENDYLSNEQMKELIKLEKPLAACYNEWLDTESSHMEMLRDTIADFTNQLVKENAPKIEKDNKNHDMER